VVIGVSAPRDWTHLPDANGLVLRDQKLEPWQKDAFEARGVLLFDPPSAASAPPRWRVGSNRTDRVLRRPVISRAPDTARPRGLTLGLWSRMIATIEIVRDRVGNLQSSVKQGGQREEARKAFERSN
jgi:hypothetical protein